MPVRFQVDGDFYDHPKTLDMSDSAVALWTRAGSYSAAKLLDGFVPEAALTLLSKVPAEASAELVRHRLWRRVRGGFQFHQYEERNLTKARIEADRDRERSKKRRQRSEHRDDLDDQSSGHRGPIGGTSTTARASDGNRSTPRRPNGYDQANTGSVPPGQYGGQPGDNPGTTRGVPGLSVSMSVSESVSGSGQPVVPPHDPDLAALVGSRPEPPRTCRQHRDDPDPPACGRCADARRDNEIWKADRRRRAAEAPDCPRHRGQPAHNCGVCRSEALGARTGEFRLIPGGAS